MEIETGKQFLKSLEKLDHKRKEAVIATVEKFRTKPSLPGLKLEKLEGFPNMWSIRVSIHDRILMSKSSDDKGQEIWTLEDCGAHDIYRRVNR